VQDDNVHIVDYSLLIKVWIALVILTGITIWVAGMELGAMSTLTAIVIATVKAILVLMFFMHLKYEPPLFVITSIVTVLTLTVIILMTFSDVWFR
jgi:cytochrome c oxidase subunit 4